VKIATHTQTLHSLTHSLTHSNLLSNHFADGFSLLISVHFRQHYIGSWLMHMHHSDSQPGGGAGRNFPREKFWSFSGKFLSCWKYIYCGQYCPQCYSC